MSAAAVKEALWQQGIELAPGREERIATVLDALLEAAAKMALPLELETDPGSHALALERCKA